MKRSKECLRALDRRVIAAVVDHVQRPAVVGRRLEAPARARPRAPAPRAARRGHRRNGPRWRPPRAKPTRTGGLWQVPSMSSSSHAITRSPSSVPSSTRELLPPVRGAEPPARRDLPRAREWTLRPARAGARRREFRSAAAGARPRRWAALAGLCRPSEQLLSSVSPCPATLRRPRAAHIAGNHQLGVAWRGHF